MIPPLISLPAGWSSAFDAGTGSTYYYRRSDGKTQWDIPVAEDTPPLAHPPPPVNNLQKSEFQKIIDEANRQMAEKQAAEKAEEERRRLELEREEQEAMEAKARERAERKIRRDERNSRRVSESDTQKSKSRLERELEIQVLYKLRGLMVVFDLCS
jgi:hypothetical protein